MHKVIEEITESNSWRDSDFARFKINAAKVDETLWCRMCIPMIYAHWEGYVVSSLKILLEYLNKLDLQPENTCTNLIVISLNDTYRSLSGKQSFSQRIEFTRKFSETYNKNLKFTKKIDTKSNLKSTVLRELCEMFDFNFDCFKNHTPNIDRLVNIRNSIAHGENSYNPDMENINLYIESVKNAADLLLTEINKFIEKEEYLIKK